jgi:hypothetical protein
MSIKLALLKSGEEVIADIKELVNGDEKIVSFIFSHPYRVKLLTPQVLMENIEEEVEREYSVSFSPWMPLSIDTDILVDINWVVSVVEPIEMVKKSYKEKMNGRGNAGDGVGTNHTGSNLNESVDFNK